MWVPGGILEFIAMTICFFTWVHFEQEKDKALVSATVSASAAQADAVKVRAQKD